MPDVIERVVALSVYCQGLIEELVSRLRHLIDQGLEGKESEKLTGSMDAMIELVKHHTVSASVVFHYFKRFQEELATSDLAWYPVMLKWVGVCYEVLETYDAKELDGIRSFVSEHLTAPAVVESAPFVAMEARKFLRRKPVAVVPRMAHISAAVEALLCYPSKTKPMAYGPESDALYAAWLKSHGLVYKRERAPVGAPVPKTLKH
jgi:hypothetical protein